MTLVKSVEVYQPIALLSIPHGKYKGKWGGYVATAIINGEQFRFNTVDGIRTISADCEIIVNNDGIFVEVVKEY